jgi:hypothetical protein
MSDHPPFLLTVFRILDLDPVSSLATRPPLIFPAGYEPLRHSGRQLHIPALPLDVG